MNTLKVSQDNLEQSMPESDGKAQPGQARSGSSSAPMTGSHLIPANGHGGGCPCCQPEDDELDDA